MNKTMMMLILAVVAILIFSPAEAKELKRTRLANGLTIITKPAKANNIVSVVVTLRLGSLYETDEDAGISSLMQSTITKGTSSRSSEQIALDLESMGTRLGASADREYGSITMQSTSESLNKSLDIMFDIMKNATFPTDAVELQKKLQTRSILLRNDQPLYRAVDLLVEAHYGSHPFHKPRLGYPETIETFTRDDLAALYRMVYTPNNMVITVVGNFEEKEFIDTVQSSLGSLPKGRDLVKTPGTLPQPTEPIVKTESRETAACWYALGWPSASLSDPDMYAMEVLNGITGGSMNSRLFVAIREKRGLAYQVSSFVNARRENGIFVAYIGTKPESYEESKTVLLDEIHAMAVKEPSVEEIENAKSYLKGMNIMEQESNAGQAEKYGLYELLGVGYEFADEYGPSIDKVTARDIVEAGKRYLLKPYSLGGVLSQ